MNILKLMLVLVFLLVASCSNNTIQNDNEEKVAIAATFFPIYDLTRTIATDAEVFSLVPAGVEPHDYEPTPNDIVKINNADIFVTMGLEFDELEKRMIEGSDKDIETIKASEGIELLDATEQEEHEEEIHEEEHEGEGKDPHIWLSPNNMVKMAQNINIGLNVKYPEKAEEYNQNTQKLVDELKKLDNEFKIGLKNCDKDTVLVSHRAFAYLARDYGFNQISISGLEPETEPSPKELIKLEEEAREHGIKYIFYEELVDPRVSQTIAREIGAQTLELNPLEGSKNPNENYFTLMRKNLANLRIALECK